jgi:hypothetical protein
MLRRVGALLGLFSALACGGKADLGEECDTHGSTDECAVGTVCTVDLGGRRCRLVCKDDTHCASFEACNGVASTNIKSCQPKK